MVRSRWEPLIGGQDPLHVTHGHRRRRCRSRRGQSGWHQFRRSTHVSNPPTVPPPGFRTDLCRGGRSLRDQNGPDRPPTNDDFRTHVPTSLSELNNGKLLAGRYVCGSCESRTWSCGRTVTHTFSVLTLVLGMGVAGPRVAGDQMQGRRTSGRLTQTPTSTWVKT